MVYALQLDSQDSISTQFFYIIAWLFDFLEVGNLLDLTLTNIYFGIEMIFYGPWCFWVESVVFGLIMGKNGGWGPALNKCVWMARISYNNWFGTAMPYNYNPY